MGCLNSGEASYWFGNIHLSGPCNRSCYFCIGQHMMALDKLNVLDTWPLPGLDDFVERCHHHDVKQVNLTGTNTDPLLYRHLTDYALWMRLKMPGVSLGLRTNGVANKKAIGLFDRVSLTICSLNPATYREMMGQGDPPDLAAYVAHTDLKVNVVMGPENWQELPGLVAQCEAAGVRRMNLREPYGQPHVGNPMEYCPVVGEVYGMPTYQIGNLLVTYWDVHWCEVESVNL